MNFKIDTKEKFCVIRIEEIQFIDTMSATLSEICNQKLTETVKNVILDFSKVESMSNTAIENIASLQQLFFENQASFVLCCLNDSLKKQMIDVSESLEYAITPTESEAWDIVQMEEIERELLDGDDFDF